MVVEFNSEQQYKSPKYLRKAQSPKGILGLVIKLGIAKNEQQANLVLIGLIIVLMIISFFSIRSMTDGPAVTEIDPTIDPETGMPYDETMEP